MHLLAPLKEITARLVVEPLLAAGVAPSRSPGADIFRWALRDRDLRFPEKHPLKPVEEIAVWDNTFALSRSSLLWLWTRLQRGHPATVLEFGSGRTTFALALHAKRCAESGHAVPTIITVEAESEWLSQTQTILTQHHLDQHVHFVHADAIKSSDHHGYALDADLITSLLGGRSVELLLIDGPSGGWGRSGTLRSVYRFLAPQAEIFLDDCDRENERNTLQTWIHEFHGDLTNRGILPTVGGLGWITRAAT